MLYPLSYGGSVGLSFSRLYEDPIRIPSSAAAVAIRESPVRKGYRSGTTTSYFSKFTAR
jgi:hypothetical protein